MFSLSSATRRLFSRLRRFTSATLLVALVASIAGPGIPVAKAVNTITPTALISAPTYYKASSGVKAVAKLVVAGDEAGDYLSRLTFTFSGAGWDAADIVDLDAAPASSGVGLYLDDGDGTFDGGDTAITSSGQNNPTWAGGGAGYLSYALSGDTQMGVGSLTYFVTLQTDSTLDDTDAITFTLNSVNVQAVVEAVGTAVSFIGDTTQPTISAVETKDLNGNGAIDALKLTYGATEYLDDSTIAIGDYTYTPVGTEALDGAYTNTIGGIAFASGIGTGTANDNIVYLKLAEGNSTTATRGQLAAGAAGVADLAGNTSVVYGATQVTDTAAPALLSATYRDLDTNGQIDTLRTTWSENVTMSGSTAADWTIVGGSINATFAAAADDAVAGTTLDVTVTADVGETSSVVAPTIAYANVAPLNSVVDAAGVPNAAGTNAAVTATDAAGPQIVTVTGNAGAAALAVTLSEPAYDTADDSALDAADFTPVITGGQTITASDHVAGAATLNLTLSAPLANDGTDYNGNDTVASTVSIEDALNNAAAVRTVNITDGTAPTITAAVTGDTNGDGTVDQLSLTFSEPVDITDGNGVDGVTGLSVNTCAIGNADYAANNTTSLVLTLTGCAAGNTSLTPTVTYDADAGNAIMDNGTAPTEVPDNEAETATDGAKPVIKDVQIEDTDANGLIDKITYTWTENIDTDDGVAPVAADLPATVLPDGIAANFGAATISDPGGANGLVVVTGITGQLTKNTAAAATAISGDLSAKWKDSAANTPHAANATGNEAVTDLAAPVVASSLGADSNNDGKTNSYTITFSENLTDKGAAAANANFTAKNAVSTGAITITTVGVGATAGGGADKVTLNLDNADTDNYTGTIQWTYNAAGGGAIVEDAAAATSDTANFTDANLTDTVAPVLLSARGGDTGGTADVLNFAGEMLDFVFSETMTAPANTTALDGALTFANGAVDGTNFDAGANQGTVTLRTTTLANDTIRVTYGGASASGNLITPGTDTVQVTGAGITDAATAPVAANTNPAAVTVAVADITAPTITARETQDLDGDGQIDAVKITFDDNVQDSSVTAANFDVAGYVGEAFAGTTNGDVANNNIIYITLTELGAADSGALPTVTYTAGTLVDDSNNALATTGAVAATDAALPVITNTSWQDNSGDGNIDRAVLTFSEQVDVADGSGADALDSIAITGTTIDNFDYVASNTTTLTLNFTGDQIVGSAIAGLTVTYSTAGANAITDNAAAPNEVLNADLSESYTDAAKPAITAAVLKDMDSNGKIDRVDTTWSENLTLDATAATAHGMQFQGHGVVGFTSVTAFTVAGGTNLLNISIPELGQSVNTAVGDFELKYNTGTNDLTDGTNTVAAVTLTSASTPALTDSSAPALVAVREWDLNGDGKVDETMLTYSESILDASVTAGDYTIGGVAADTKMGVASANGTDANVLNDNIITIKVAAGVTGTEQKAVVYTAGTTTDASAVAAPTQTFAAGSVTDSALPVLTTKTYADNGADGSVDRLALGFSEPVTWNGSDLTQVAVTANGLTGFAGTPTAVAGSGTATLTLTVPATTGLTGVNGGVEPQAAFTQSGTAGNRIKDVSANELASFGATSLVDAATPVPLSYSYKDVTVVDGAVDRVDVTFSENLVKNTYTDGAYTVPTAGSITLVDETATAVVGAVLRLTVTADANETGGATAPTISYATVGNELEDGAGNDVASFGPLTLTDGAAPFYLAAATLDNNGDGTVDYVKVTYSEAVADASVAGTDFAVGIADTTVGNLTESFTSLTPSSGTLTDTANDNIVYIGVGSSGETIAAGTTSYTLKVQQIGAVDDAAANSLASFALQVSTDGAAPVATATAYKDTNADGTVDRVDLTFSEAPVLDSYVGGDWTTAVAGTIGLGVETLAAVNGNDVRVTIAGTASTTGGAVNPQLTYTNAANRLHDAASNNVATFTATATDGAAPLPLNVTSSKGLSNGNLQSGTVLTVTFSENVTVTQGSIDVTDDGGNNAGSDVSVILKPDGSNADYVIGSLTDATARFTQGAANQLLITASAMTTEGTFLTQAKLNIGNAAGLADAAANLPVAAGSDLTISGLVGPAVDAIAAASITTTGATASWITFTGTTNNYVKYGTNPESLGSTTAPTGAATAHSHALAGLTAATRYYYQVCSTDTSETCSDIHNFTTSSTTDVVAPTISLTSSTPTAATNPIVFQSTEAGTAYIRYGIAADYGNQSETVSVLAATNKTVTLTGLTCNVTYHYQIYALDAASNVSNNLGDATFTTSACTSDITAPTAPVITTTLATVNADFYTIAGTVTADTDDLVVRVLNGATLAATANVPAGQTTWSVTVPLTQSTPNSFTAVAYDESSNASAASASVVITESAVDIVAPVASTSITNITTTTADIVVAVDESADYQVKIDTSSTFGSATTLHAYTVAYAAGPFIIGAASLAANTVYYVQVKVKDAAANEATRVYAFTTNQLNAPVLTSILATTDATLPSSKVTVAWNSQNDVAGEPTGTLNSTSNAIQYGTTISLGTTVATTTGDGVAAHSKAITGLTANTTYYYRVKSIANSKTSYSQIFSFRTAAADTGIVVGSIEMLKQTATADDTYANGWKWAVHVTVNNPAETNFKMLFANWSNGAATPSTIATSGNMRIGLTNEATGASDATIDAATQAIGTAYTDQATALTLVDEDPTTGGIQETVYVYMQVPTGTTGGNYSTSYGVQSN